MQKITKEIAEKIEANLKELNEKIPTLNAGGCGVFASCFAEEMIKLGYQAKVFEIALAHPDIEMILFGAPDLDYYKQHFAENKANVHMVAKNHEIPNNKNIPAVGDHFCVEIDGYYFDSTSCSKLKDEIITLHDDNYKIVGEMPLNDIEYVSIEKRGNIWNTRYEAKYNSLVNKQVQKAIDFLKPNRNN